MSKEHEDRIDPGTPGLLVLYGATKRKFRPLTRDITVIGRAPSSDIGLVSPEVAPTHCLIVRLASGWRIRDCSSRATRVNGEAVQDEPLRNGDTIQVGNFSFEAHLPPACLPVPVIGPAVDVDRLQRSRRRLVELALGLRQRLREQSHDQTEIARQQADLDQLERRFRKMHEEQQAKQTRLAEEEKALALRAAELDHYAQHLRAQAQEPHDVDDSGLRELEAELEQQRHEQAEEAELLAELRHSLEARQVELDEERHKLAADREEVARQRIEVERLRDRHAHTPFGTSDTHLEVAADSQMESARKLLRELAERRKVPQPGEKGRGKASRARQPRPPR